MRFRPKETSLTVGFAALYAVSVIVLAPISFYVWQVRVADALLPLSMIFGMPCALGLSLGCIIGNIYGGLGSIDIIGGSIANFLACLAAYQVGRRKNSIFMRFLGSLAETIIITVIVGGYLSYLFNIPLGLSMLGILVGSLIAINLMGFALEEIIRRVYAPLIKR
ncbi:MAG: QueT transporter family protein [Candidatus Bathyarchaeia archaeon]